MKNYVCVTKCCSKLIYQTLQDKQVVYVLPSMITSILGRLPVVQAGYTGTIQFKYRTLTLQQQCPLIQPYPRQGWLKTLGRGQMLHAPCKFLGNLNASGLWLPVVPWPVMMNEVWSVPCDSMCYFASWISAGLLHSDTVPMVMKQDTFESICSI